MLDTVIFILFTVCGALVGFFFSRQLSERTRYLGTFINAVRMMSIYIRYNRLQFDELFLRLRDELKLPLSERLVFLAENGMSFEAEWTACINKINALKKEDRTILIMLGEELGKSDTEGQILSLDATKELLSANMKKAEEERDVKGRLYRTLGILLGAAIGIVCI